MRDREIERAARLATPPLRGQQEERDLAARRGSRALSPPARDYAEAIVPSQPDGSTVVGTSARRHVGTSARRHVGTRVHVVLPSSSRHSRFHSSAGLATTSRRYPVLLP